ncbi:MAG: hypothetical protein II661_04235, partial [Bacteroidales bacterium]|nr:hypothetical protein [Bacteroidales bacterium]
LTKETHMNTLKKYSLNIKEDDYHAYPAWSYSKISDYAKEGFSALATINDKKATTPSMKFGSLFDSILTRGKATLDSYIVMDVSVPKAEREALDYISTCTNLPFSELTPEYIYDKTNECGYQARMKMDTKYEKLKQYSAYYDILKSGKEVVSQQEWDDAIEMAHAFRNSAYLKELFGTKNTKDMEYLYQLQFVEDYTLPSGRTVPVKCMLDLVVVDHANKTIQPVDLKTSAMPAFDFTENFLKYRYDLQAHLYSDILTIVKNKDEELKDYTVLPYLFTDISRSDKVPVTWCYPQNDESQKNGFHVVMNGKEYQYKKWDALLDEILTYQEQEAKVPSYITLDGPNDLLSILGR